MNTLSEGERDPDIFHGVGLENEVSRRLPSTLLNPRGLLCVGHSCGFIDSHADIV